MRILLLMLCLSALFSAAFAGSGHDHGESAFAGSSAPAKNFELDEVQMKNLGVRFESVQKLPIQETIDMIFFTELLPENRATISPRFGGKIIDISVKVGQEVRKGQDLATLEPISVGNRNVVLTSPLKGFVVSQPAGVGEIIEPGEPIMEIGDPAQMLLRGVMYETPDITKVAIGQTAHAHLDIKPDHELVGTVQRINRVIDPKSRTFSIYVLINTPEGDISPGLQGRMEVAIGDSDPVLTVPKRAVLGEMGSFFVYVIEGTNVERRDVIIGEKSGNHIEIKNGVEASDSVITQGNYQLQYLSVGGVHTHDHDHDHEDKHRHDDHHKHEDEHEHDDSHQPEDDHEHHDHDPQDDHEHTGSEHDNHEGHHHHADE